LFVCLHTGIQYWYTVLLTGMNVRVL